MCAQKFHLVQKRFAKYSPKFNSTKLLFSAARIFSYFRSSLTYLLQPIYFWWRVRIGFRDQRENMKDWPLSAAREQVVRSKEKGREEKDMLSWAHMQMFRIAIYKLFEWLFSRVLVSHLGGPGLVPGWDMSILGPLIQDGDDLGQVSSQW